MTNLDIGVYVPQMGFSYADVLHRALRCEELGIGSLWLYDHLYGPAFPRSPRWKPGPWPPRC
ncbi:luciferase-like domain protein [Mycobacterium xenopi 4042]|uniref:Luciferase-like domain protein n=1 Tax=Mycobacterium xenopi 4042 TaxID=1299334 RepID=X8AFL2_MYCXE|nr:luciferase-like domain protein [Mycobacterium xenopi 4042]EUA51009.1 luciferase-like domain protein [Mycobacterium xenopi 3993]